MRLAALVLAGSLALGAGACNGSTGNQLIEFTAYARGASGAASSFDAGSYTVKLTKARMLIGAVYVDQSPLGNQAGGPACIVPDLFAAQVPGPVEVNLLDDQPQEFTVYGQGTLDRGASWQIWLTDGDINEANHSHVVDLQGTATRKADGYEVPFAAIVTINDNRLTTTVNPATPGANPICKKRIVLLGGLDTTFADGGKLTVTVDPRPWFQLGFDFASLPAVTDDNCLLGDTSVPVDPAADFGTAKVCIPNTNYATGAGALAGSELFTSILGGSLATYSLSFQAP